MGYLVSTWVTWFQPWVARFQSWVDNQTPIQPFQRFTQDNIYPAVVQGELILNLIGSCITMDFKEFKQSLTRNEPPDSAGIHLKALWHDGKGNWEQAHAIIQDIHDTAAAEIHAYLHRKEGDQWNADYWYRRAGSKSPKLTLDEEWTSIVRRLIQ